jgi:hypothetical protein
LPTRRKFFDRTLSQLSFAATGWGHDKTANRERTIARNKEDRIRVKIFTAGFVSRERLKTTG